MVGPSFSGKTYLMLKILSRMSYRYVFINTKSPLEQYFSSKTKIKEVGEAIKPLKEYKNANIVFDDILGSSISRNIDQFFIPRRHSNKVFLIYHNSILVFRKEL